MMVLNFAVSAFVCLAGSTAANVTYMTDVKLEGRLVSRSYYGAPNYDKHSRRDYEYVLLLKKPINAVGIPSDDSNHDSFNNIAKLQVSADAELQPYRNKTVVIEGTLYEGLTGHDHTPVILEVKTIRPK
jgi:hypothetical protein